MLIFPPFLNSCGAKAIFLFFVFLCAWCGYRRHHLNLSVVCVMMLLVCEGVPKEGNQKVVKEVKVVQMEAAKVILGYSQRTMYGVCALLSTLAHGNVP